MILQLGHCLFLRFLLQFLLAYTTPRHVHADGDAGVGTQRDELLTGLAQKMIHADEEIIAARMDIQHPTHAGRKAVHGEVNAAIQPAQRLQLALTLPSVQV